MIRITKPSVPPTTLQTRGKQKTTNLKIQYTKYTVDYRNGTRTFKFDSGIYGHRDVKFVLKTSQHGKCVFCESKITHIAYGDVEHFRPKGGYKQNKGDLLGKPGYYWLAYEWSNLYYSCQICNQRFKRNLFPLANPQNRACNHNDNISSEQPLLIDPGNEDPEQFISFRANVVYAVSGDQRGKITIEVLGLNRLDEDRQERYDMLKTLSDITKLPPSGGLKQSTINRARTALTNAVSDSGEYAAMARTAVRDNFQY